MTFCSNRADCCKLPSPRQARPLFLTSHIVQNIDYLKFLLANTLTDSSMPKAKSPFFIWFTGRSGSTHLCDLLDSHPQIYCRKENFSFVKNPGEVPYRSRMLFTPGRKIKNPASSEVLDYLNQIYSTDSLAAGFKFKFPNQSRGFPEVTEQLPQIPGIKVIELIRENTLKQVISIQNRKRIKAMGVSRGANLLESLKLEPLLLDVDTAVDEANKLLLRREEFRQYSAMFSDSISITYEQICFEPQQIIPQILEFLNVDTNVDLTSRFFKTTPDNIREAVANYEELVAAVKGTKLEEFLD